MVWECYCAVTLPVTMVKTDGKGKSSVKVMNSLIAGSMAGMVAKTIVAPVDRIKIMYQASTKPFTYKKGWKTAENIYKHQGWKALWRGNTASLARVAPYSAIQFTVHEQLKFWFDLRTYEQKLQKPLLCFLAGGISGFCAITLTYPLDVARARMATDTTYKNIYDVVKRSLLAKDVKYSMYRGFLPAVLGIVPYTGISFLIYELFKTRYFKQAANSKNRVSLAIENIVLGGSVSFLGQTVIYPLDVLRRRMQTNVQASDLTLIKCFKYIIKKEGIRGIFKGISLSWFKLPIILGTSMTTFDSVYYFLNKYN